MSKHFVGVLPNTKESEMKYYKVEFKCEPIEDAGGDSPEAKRGEIYILEERLEEFQKEYDKLRNVYLFPPDYEDCMKLQTKISSIKLQIKELEKDLGD